MSSIPLSAKQVKFLRSTAHALKPVVIVGQLGLSEAVLAEIELALQHHELLKIRINADDRDSRETMIDTIVDQCACRFVQKVGHVATFYRPNPEQQRIQLPRQ